MSLFLDTFRNTMGDFNVPAYSHWVQKDENDKVT